MPDAMTPLGQKYPTAEDCPDVKRHTPDPSGYLAWHEWAEKKAKTHVSTQCPTCGFWSIWKRKHPAHIDGSGATDA